MSLESCIKELISLVQPCPELTWICEAVEIELACELRGGVKNNLPSWFSSVADRSPRWTTFVSPACLRRSVSLLMEWWRLICVTNKVVVWDRTAPRVREALSVVG